MSPRALTLTLLFAPALALADHLVVTIPGDTGPGVASRFVVVERLDDAGVPLTGGAQDFLVTTDSPTGEFTQAPWGLSFSDGGIVLGFPFGGSRAQFSYRDKAIKTHNLKVDGPGYPTVIVPLSVAPALIDEDFEGGVLMTDSPAGLWPWLQLSAGNNLVFSRSGAHRGDGGLEEKDIDPGTLDGGGSGHLGFFVDRLTTTLYFRGWVQRRSVTGGPLSFIVFITGAGVVFMVELDAEGGVGFGGATNGGGFSWTPRVASIPNSQWSLISGKLSGLGTDAGRRDLFVGGAAPAQQKDQGLLGQSLNTVFLGAVPGSSRTFTGNLYLDDVRISTQPTADTLEVLAPITAPTLACSTIYLRLINTIDQTVAAAPYDVDVEVKFKGPGELYLNAECSGPPTSTVRIPKGQSKVSASLTAKGAIGETAIVPSHLDFLSKEAGLTFLPGATLDGGRLPDGGFDPTVHRDLKVGCACSSSSPVFASALLLALALRRRRQ